MDYLQEYVGRIDDPARDYGTFIIGFSIARLTWPWHLK
jgi:hypothetical protein